MRLPLHERFEPILMRPPQLWQELGLSETLPGRASKPLSARSQLTM